MKNPFLFDLAKSKPIVDKKKSGSVRGDATGHAGLAGGC